MTNYVDKIENFQYRLSNGSQKNEAEYSSAKY